MASRIAKRSLTLSYVLGGVLVALGLPIFWGYVGAIFPLVIGLATLVRARRRARLMGHS